MSDLWDEFDAAVDAGMDARDAYADAAGLTRRHVWIEDAKNRLRADGYAGSRFDDLVRQAHRDVIAGEVRAAEDACNGYLVRAVRGCAPPAPIELWRNPDWYASKWSTDELKAWWDEHGGRTTYEDYKKQVLAGGAASATGGGDWLK